MLTDNKYLLSSNLDNIIIRDSITKHAIFQWASLTFREKVTATFVYFF